MPAKAPKGAFDTYDMYKVENVSYGLGKEFTLTDGSTITFVSNTLVTAIKIDERNLVYCKYL